MQKPSVKNIILIAIAIAIIGAAFIVSKYENRAFAGMAAENTQNNLQLTAVSASSTDDSNIAYSGNWEKTLSNAVVGVWGASTTIASSSNQKLTPTDQFGRNIFTRFAQAQNAGEDTSDPNVQQAIVKEVLADGTVLPTPKVYTSSDIKIERDNSSSSLTQYGTAIATIFVNDMSMSPHYETDIVQSSLDANDPTLLKQLDPFIVGYQKIITDYLATPVPSNMADLHVNVINAMSELLFADQSFEKTYADALTGLAGVSAYKKGIQDLPEALANIKEYLVSENITFDPSSPASIFNVQK